MFRAIGAIALVASCANAYENSSPFFFHSTSQINDLPSIPALAPASTIHHVLSQALSSCPTKKYAVILQPGVLSEDYQCIKSTPFLAGKVGQSAEGSTNIMVKEVIEQVDTTAMINTILMDCLHHGIKTVQPLDTSSLILPEVESQKLSESVIYAPMPTIDGGLSREERKVVLRNHDMYVEGLIRNYFGGEDYTLLYVTEPSQDTTTEAAVPEGKEYQMESEVPLVADTMRLSELAKRNLESLKSNFTRGGNQTLIDGPLFEKYQFFSPGIFMGLFVGFILLSLLYVGISALSSLQVTYAAFDKEQGQLAAKKQ